MIHGQCYYTNAFKFCLIVVILIQYANRRNLTMESKWCNLKHCKRKFGTKYNIQLEIAQSKVLYFKENLLKKH